MIGRKISHYNVTEKLGAGGMGEVYRARDTKLNRDVALKVLPEVFANDAQRMARFSREAQVLASLNHPNIASIYGLEQQGDTHALVLELVEGPTLAERIGQGALPLDEALNIAKQIAEALEAAHEKGIIHRDLKPANVKVTPEGTVKVLDFGLAKALEDDPSSIDISESPTLSVAATQAGVILGTAAYMSPEQARGQAVDRRADIWSFGVVLYEMLSGKSAFTGGTVSDVLARVLEREPEWEKLPADVPGSIKTLLKRCLTKDKRRRLGAISEANFALEEYLSNPEGAPAAITSEAPRPRPYRGLSLTGSLGIGMGVAIVALVAWQMLSRDVPPPVVRLAVPLLSTESFGIFYYDSVAVAPDGNRLVYVTRRGGTSQLHMRQLDRFAATLLAGTEGASSPFFSPDGQWVGFFAGDKLKKVSITGGAPLTICSMPMDNRGASWGSDGTIVFTPHFRPDMGLFKVPATGGQPEALTTPDPQADEGNHRWPEFLPGGEAVLMTIEKPGSVTFDQARIALLSLKTGKWRVLIEGGSRARYSSSGHILYARRGTLLAVPFDLETLETTGPAVPVLEGVVTEPSTGAAQFSLSQQGTLIYVPGEIQQSNRSLHRLDRKGTATTITQDERSYTELSISPDGRTMALTVEAADADIWFYDLVRDTLTRFTFEAGDDIYPVWTPDGRRLTYSSNRSGPFNMYWRPVDGSSPEERLRESKYAQLVGSWSPDGKLLAYAEAHPVTQDDIWILPIEGDRAPRPFLRTPFDEWLPKFSPNGKWIAYISNETGQTEIYVQPYPGPGRKWQISTAGGWFPVWARDGRELFFLSLDGELMAVKIETIPLFSASSPKKLFDVQSSGIDFTGGQVFDVTPDGQSFVFMLRREESIPRQINVVLNWFDELRRHVRTGKN